MIAVKSVPEGWCLTGKNGVMDGKSFALEDSTVSIGTDSNICTAVFPKGTAGIAQLHCQLILKNNSWYLVDFSDSGTWLNDEMIPRGQAVPLKQGDMFSLANSGNNFILSYEPVVARQNRQGTSPPPPAAAEGDFLKYVRENFFTFKGRLNRKPYLLRILAIMILNAVNWSILLYLDTIPVRQLSDFGKAIIIGLLIFWVICVVATFALDIRRLHDTDHSGWWVLTLFIPFVQIYPLYLLVFKAGTPGYNRFGADPLT